MAYANGHNVQGKRHALPCYADVIKATLDASAY